MREGRSSRLILPRWYVPSCGLLQTSSLMLLIGLKLPILILGDHECFAQDRSLDQEATLRVFNGPKRRVLICALNRIGHNTWRS